MQLNERKQRKADFSVDRDARGFDKPDLARPHRANSGGFVRWRICIAFSLVAALLLPVEALASTEDPPWATTTTTIPPSTTTTAAVTTTTNVEPTTSTTSAVTTTSSIAESTSTTIPGSSTTTTLVEEGIEDVLLGEGDPLAGEDPFDEEEPEEEPELLPLPSIRFPVAGPAAYSDTYDAPRDGGARLHKGTDISSPQGTPVVAVANGKVVRMGVAPKAGLYVVLRHTNGWQSLYAHLNNDSPGTDNGLTMGFGPAIRVGTRVRVGTVLGYVGDSGNAETTSYHLHFELRQPDGYKANPYPALRKARKVSEPIVLPTVDYDEVQALDTELVAHVDPGTGFNAGIAALDDHAYIGTWGNAQRCPGTGVRVFDTADPQAPALATTFADHTRFPGTAASSVWVGNVANDVFEGRVGVVGLEACANRLAAGSAREFVGLATYDLTDPTDPTLLATLDTSEWGLGVENVDISSADGRLLAAALVADRTAATQGQQTLLFLDLTDPTDPLLSSVWQRPLSVAEEAQLVTAPSNPDNDALPEGLGGIVVWLDHETVGASFGPNDALVLDVSDLTNPVAMWGTSDLAFDIPRTLVAGRFLDDVEEIDDPRGAIELIQRLVGDEPVTLETGDAAQEGQFEPGPGFHALHRSMSYGTGRTFAARLSSGAALTGFDGTLPHTLGYFVPAPAFDPQHWWVAPDGRDTFPMVWDVAVSEGLLYLSDHHSGLWIFTLTQLEQAAPDPHIS